MSNIADENELPDDFFNDLADSKFVETVVENPSNAGSEDDEQMTRCLAEIEKLQKDIERRKKKILKGEAGFSETEKRKVRERNSRSRSRSRAKRERKRIRSRSRESSPSVGGGGSSSRLNKRRNHHHDRKGRSRSRTRSPKHRRRSSSMHKNLTFLEELERTFAEKGQSFPEKDLLLLNQNTMHSTTNSMLHSNMNEPHIPMAIDYGNNGPFNQGPLPLVSYPIQHQNMYYGINPMNIMASNANPSMGQSLGGNGHPIPPIQFPVGNVSHEPHPTQRDMEHVQMFQQTNEPIQVANQNALIERCEHAIKLVRAKDNKVPVLKFLFNRTSTIVANSSDAINMKSATKSPLQIHSPLNVPFKLNAQPNVRVNKVNGIRMLPKRVKDVCTALSIDTKLMFDRMRTKEVSNHIADQLIETNISDAHQSDVLVSTRTIPIVETSEMSTQTKVFDCEKCTERQKRVMVNVHSQVTPKSFNIATQTDEKDYREPIVKQLSQMTAAQLVAIQDFADIITEPIPKMAVEMYRIRERLMDIYNLSQRDADAVKIEEQRMAELQRINEEQHFGEGSSMRNRSACDMYSDINMNPNSPPIRNGGNFDLNDMNDSRGFMMDDRGSQQQRFSEERQYQSRISLADEQRLLDEQRMIERERLIEIEHRRIQQREREMREQEQRLEKEILMRQMTTLQQQQQQQQQQHHHQQPIPLKPFDSDLRDYNRSDDRPNFNLSPRGGAINNRRGRGAFRDNCWIRGNRR